MLAAITKITQFMKNTRLVLYIIYLIAIKKDARLICVIKTQIAGIL